MIVLVRWWREIIFERIERKRRKSGFEQWLLARRDGWRSFLAALAGAVVLFAGATVRLARAWVGGMHLTRRVLAYLFQRDMTKMSVEKDTECTPLEPEQYARLGPETRSAAVVPSAADGDVGEHR